MSGARVMCMSPGCSVFFDIEILDRRFPHGPFHCPRCVARLRALPHPEGESARPDDDSLAPVVIDELGEGIATVIVTVPKKW